MTDVQWSPGQENLYYLGLDFVSSTANLVLFLSILFVFSLAKTNFLMQLSVVVFALQQRRGEAFPHEEKDPGFPQLLNSFWHFHGLDWMMPRRALMEKWTQCEWLNATALTHWWSCYLLVNRTQRNDTDLENFKYEADLRGALRFSDSQLWPQRQACWMSYHLQPITINLLF